MINSPNGLTSTKPIVARMGKWPLYVALCGLMCMGAALIYSVSFVHDPQEEVKKSKKVAVSEHENKSLLPNTEQTSGVVGGLKEKIEEKQAEKVQDKGKEPLLIVQESTAADEEAERIKQLRTQAYFTALSAPLVAKRVNSANDAGANSQPNMADMADMANVNERQASSTDYDPYSQQDSNMYGQGNPADSTAADKEKEAFYSRSKTGDSSWMLGNARTVGQKFEIKTGTVIPSVMLSAINADLPGALIAQVSQNVYNSSTGDNLLIPRGSRLYGAYDSRVIYGQRRVLVAWNRLIFPDGSAITLGAMPGSDMAGQAGFEDKVNNHYWRTFGSAVLMSLVTGGMAYGMDSMNSSNDDDDETTMQGAMVTALAAQLGQTTTALLQKNLNIKPTLEIRTGYQFNIVVTKDIVFEKPYKAWR